MKTITLTIDGMTCMGCVRTITQVLNTLPGVIRCEVSKELANASIEFDETQTNPNSLKEAIEDAGFDVK